MINAEKLQAEVDKAMEELEGARNVSVKADSLVLLKELVSLEIMNVDSERRKADLELLKVKVANEKT